MRLALILVYVFFISATGQTAQAAISDDILYNGINSLYGGDNPEIILNICRNTLLSAIDSRSVTTDGYLLDDCLFNMQPETALFAYDPGGTKRLDELDDKGTKLAGLGYHSMYARAEISAIDSGRDGELVNKPSPSNNYYDEVVSWLEDTYQAWDAKNHYDSARLLLLSFGFVGLIGIRRQVKKR